jgi:predicted DNA-binding protein
MATAKVTFTLDRATVSRLRQAAERLGRPKSQVVREAIHDYYERMGKLSEQERLRMLRVLDEMMARPPSRTQAEADKELRAIRRSRRAGSRRSAAPMTT